MVINCQGVNRTFVKEVTLKTKNPKASNKGGDQINIVGTHATRPHELPIETTTPVTPTQ